MLMTWKINSDEKEWDTGLANLGGHPLQSTLWGNAKRIVCGVTDERLALYQQNKLIGMARIEIKGLKPWLKCAWIPQGPVVSACIDQEAVKTSLLAYLKKTGYLLCVSAPWQSAIMTSAERKTIWLDLTIGKENLWENLDKQWRYGVRSAIRFGVVTNIANTQQELSDFYQLCTSISREKKFHFQYSEKFFRHLFHQNHGDVETKLFLAKYENRVVAGAFIFRVGKTIHYMFGAVNRNYAKQRAGELIQWAVIEWAILQNYMLYDLGGINQLENPGVAAFKKKMGGEVVALQDMQLCVLNRRGALISGLVKSKLSQ